MDWLSILFLILTILGTILPIILNYLFPGVVE